MNKKLMIGIFTGCVVAAAIAARTQRDTGPKPTVWDKMRHRMEEMPENFPPRFMFDNLEAARANTEKILTMLETNTVQDKDVDVMAST